MSRPSIPQLALSRFPFYAIFLMNSATPLFPRYDPTGERPLTVGILVLDQTNMLSLAAAVDPMRAANRRAERRLFDWRFLTATDLPAQITAGFPITGQPIATIASLRGSICTTRSSGIGERCAFCAIGFDADLQTLSGFATTAQGKRLVFAIFSIDAAARRKIKTEERENPPGAAAWNKKAKRLQQALLEHWAVAYSA